MLRILCVAICSLVSTVVLAEDEASRRLCANEKRPAADRIAACTSYLSDGQLQRGDRARALLARGKIYFDRGNLGAALGDLRQSVELDREDANGHYWLGRVLGQTATPADALRSFDEALRVRPGWPNAINARGIMYGRQGDNAKAIEAFSAAIKADPHFLVVYKNRGEAYERIGDRAKAVVDYQHVVATPARPGEVDDERVKAEVAGYLKRLAATGRASSDGDRGACERASADARVEACGRIIADATATSAEQVSALMSRSLVYQDRRQYEAVIADMDRLLQIKSDHVAALSRRANAKGDLNRATDAIADYDVVLKLEPGSVWALNGRGNAHRSLGQFERALADYDEATRIAPGFLWPVRNRAYAQERLGLFEEAEAGYRLVIQARERPGNNDDRRAKRDAENDLRRLASLKEARARTEVRFTRRVALVIANTRYTGSFDALTTPSTDVRAVAAALKRSGFKDEDVVEKHDLDRRGMIAALREFEGKARTADWAMVFFAGHGVRARSNLDYMIPIDAQIESERDLADEAVALERVVERIGDAKKLQLVVFDACRSNDLTRRLYSVTNQQRSASQSAAPFEAPGLILAFSARRGQSAFDGKTNSPFVEALLTSMDRPGADLESVLNATAEQVKKVTGDQQVPEIYGLGYGKGVVLRAGR